jgi:hypothetical protein
MSALAPAAVPAELRARPQWVVWRSERRDGKPTKVPYVARPPLNRGAASGTRRCWRASTTDPSTWRSFEEAVSLARDDDWDGIGYVFSADDPFVGVDLDSGLSEADRGAIMLALDSYAETSVSGQGVHVIVRAELNGYPRNRRGPIEVYDHGRYFVVTGQHVRGTPTTIEERQAELDAVLAEFLPAPLTAEVATSASVPVGLDDRELLDRALAARNGADFRELWEGRWQGRHGSQSEADLALCSMLAFWTGRDPGRMDALFRASGLMRDKWLERRGDTTYGAQTIEKAIAGCQETYTGKRELPTPLPGAHASHNGSGLDLDLDPSQAEESPFHEAAAEAEPPRGLTHREALEQEIPPTHHLVQDLIDAGTVGVIAGLPFARKTFVLHELACKVAAGSGLMLGRFEVVRPGPVVIAWQDDSTENELGRIQDYHGRHDYPRDLPIRWLLNEGIRLPDHADLLAEIVAADKAVLLGLDSLYNLLAPDVKLKDEDVAVVLADVKRAIADATGATVAIVDHAPWPTEGNRGQRRAYGSVFKTAAIRWSIHLEADGKDDTRLHVEASGNNVRGFRRTPAIFDEDTLEIRLLDVQRLDEDALDEDVLAYVEAHPGEATSRIANGLGKRRETVENSLKRLSDPGRLEPLQFKTSRDLGRPGTGHYWFPHNHAGSEPSQLFGTSQDASQRAPQSEGEASEPSAPRRGDASPWGHSLEDPEDGRSAP